MQSLVSEDSKKKEFVQHHALRFKVLESLLWSSDSKVGVPIQDVWKEGGEMGSTNSAKIHKTLRNLAIEDWKPNCFKFTECFLALDPRLIIGQNSTGDTRVTGDEVSQSLLSQMKKSKVEELHACVLKNLCGAAVGLRALMLVRSNKITSSALGVNISSQSGRSHMSKPIQDYGSVKKGKGKEIQDTSEFFQYVFTLSSVVGIL